MGTRRLLPLAVAVARGRCARTRRSRAPSTSRSDDLRIEPDLRKAIIAASLAAVALTAAPAGEGLAWTVLGAAAAVPVVGIAVALAHRV